MRSFLAIAGLLVTVNVLGFSGSVPRHQPGIIAKEAPLQASTQATPFEIKGFKITPLAEYSISARVLARNSYWLGAEAEVSPMDIALGWGVVSDQVIIDQMQFNLSLRYLRWVDTDLRVSRETIDTHLSNNHVIPADAEIAGQLERISVGQLVKLSGQLVRAESEDGWSWESSLTRDDTGPKSGELFYVQKVEVLK